MSLKCTKNNTILLDHENPKDTRKRCYQKWGCTRNGLRASIGPNPIM